MAKILIADDEQLIRKLIGDCLKRKGHEILEAENGEIALKLFDANKDLELALLDIMMPEVDGWEVCRRIREKSDMPVILVSARSQDFDQIMGFESGADDYVTKPFSLVILSKRVDAPSMFLVSILKNCSKMVLNIAPLSVQLLSDLTNALRISS